MIVSDVVGHFEGVQIGMHTQNDTGCAVANAVAGVVAVPPTCKEQLMGTANELAIATIRSWCRI